MMGSGAVVAIRYDRADPNVLPTFILAPLRSVHVAATAWQALPLLLQLGVDIVYTTEEHSNHDILAPGGEQGGQNILLEVLTTNCDPESTGFGNSGHAIYGGSIFKYRAEDGYNMDQSLNPCLRSLEEFIVSGLAGIKAALAGQGLEAAKMEYAEMSAKEFKMFFKRYLVEHAEELKESGWEDIPCPVKIVGKACGRCGAHAGAKSGLKKCGKCGKVLYCGTGCQKKDWKAHKPFCEKA